MNKTQLHSLIDEVLNANNRSGKTKQMLELVEAVEKQPLLLWESTKIEQLSLATLQILLLDVIEEEDKEIAWVQKSYAYITQSVLQARERKESDAKLFDLLKNRVVLLHSHDDFFLDILDYFFFHNTPIEKETDSVERRAFVFKKIAAMQVQDLRVLENYAEDLRNDEYLLQAERKLEEKYNFTKNELVEAQLLSDALFKYVWHQLRKEK